MSAEKLKKEDIHKLARLSRLNVSDAEANKLLEDMNNILGYMAKLDSVDVSKVEGMSHVFGSSNVFREDKVEESMPAEVLENLAPDHSGRFIRVPIVVDQGEN